MSSRHIRRVQASELSLEADDDDSEQQDDQGSNVAPPAIKNAFGLLFDSSDDDGSSSDSGDSQGHGLRHQGTVCKPVEVSTAEGSEPAVHKSSTKRARQRRKGRGAPGDAEVTAAQEEDDEEWMKLGADLGAGESGGGGAPSSELGGEGGALSDGKSSQAAASAPPETAWRSLCAEWWKLSAANLDASTELSRKFGRGTMRLLAAAERAEHGGRGGHGARRGARGGGTRRLAGGGGALLVRARDHWPPVGGGIDMVVDRQAQEQAGIDEAELAPAGDGGEMWFVFTYTSAYRASEAMLEEAVASADPNQLQQLLQAYPYQVDGLLRLADYCTRTGQHELSSEVRDASRMSGGRGGVVCWGVHAVGGRWVWAVEEVSRDASSDESRWDEMGWLRWKVRIGCCRPD